MNRRVISAFAAVVLTAGVTCGCNKKEDKSGKISIKMTEADSQTETEAEPSSDSTTKGNSASDTSFDDADPEPDIQIDPDRILFTFEYNNYAWGAQSDIMAVMGDGRIYSFSNLPTKMNNNVDYDTRIVNHVTELAANFEPKGQFESGFLDELYSYASKVDPNANYTEKHEMCDYGQNTLYYWDENGNKVILINTGDVRYIIDDLNVPPIEALWGDWQSHIKDSKQYQDVKLFTDSEMPIKCWQCGYIELPQGSSGKYVFKNYEEFSKAAEEWGLDVPDLGIADDEFLLNQPVFVQFEIFNSIGHFRDYTGFVVADDEYFFLKSSKCSDPLPDQSVGQAMDGFVTVGVYPEKIDLPSHGGLKTNDGGYWEQDF